MNRIALSGNITDDPEIRCFEPRIRARFTLASDRIYRRRGESRASADFIPIVCWNQLAEQAASLRKGAAVEVVGRLETGCYVNGDGKKVKTFQVVAEYLGQIQDSDASDFDELEPAETSELTLANRSLVTWG